MLPLAILLTYVFTPQTKLTYDAKVTFEGFIPILGGQQGKVEVKMMVEVKGGEPKGGNLTASSKLNTIELIFNGEKLPLTLEIVEEFFPKTNITLTPLGKVLTSDAPDKRLPVKLPGLDAKRFPDITYLPLEFPASGIQLDKPFKFTKSFGDSPVLYTVTPTKIDEASVEFKVELRQDYTVLEDETSEVVKVEADAISIVKTEVIGAGTITFNRKQGAVQAMKIESTAESIVTDLVTKKVTKRKLKTILDVKLLTGS